MKIAILGFEHTHADFLRALATTVKNFPGLPPTIQFDLYGEISILNAATTTALINEIKEISRERADFAPCPDIRPFAVSQNAQGFLLTEIVSGAGIETVFYDLGVLTIGLDRELQMDDTFKSAISLAFRFGSSAPTQPKPGQIQVTAIEIFEAGDRVGAPHTFPDLGNSANNASIIDLAQGNQGGFDIAQEPATAAKYVLFTISGLTARNEPNSQPGKDYGHP